MSRRSRAERRGVLPGFGLSMGVTLLYLGLSAAVAWLLYRQIVRSPAGRVAVSHG